MNMRDAVRIQNTKRVYFDDFGSNTSVKCSMNAIDDKEFAPFSGDLVRGHVCVVELGTEFRCLDEDYHEAAKIAKKELFHHMYKEQRGFMPKIYEALFAGDRHKMQDLLNQLELSMRP